MIFVKLQLSGADYDDALAFAAFSHLQIMRHPADWIETAWREGDREGWLWAGVSGVAAHYHLRFTNRDEMRAFETSIATGYVEESVATAIYRILRNTIDGKEP